MLIKSPAKLNKEEKNSGTHLQVFALLKWGNLEANISAGAVPFFIQSRLNTRGVPAQLCHILTPSEKKYIFRRLKSCHKNKNGQCVAAVCQLARNSCYGVRLYFKTEHTSFLKATSPNKQLIYHTATMTALRKAAVSPIEVKPY